MLADTFETRTTSDEIYLVWSKPVGGNEIDHYLVQWTKYAIFCAVDSPCEVDNVHSEVIPYNGMESNTYTISNIEPAQSVNVSIRASNFAGESGTSWQIYATGTFFLIISFWLEYLFSATTV